MWSFVQGRAGRLGAPLTISMAEEGKISDIVVKNGEKDGASSTTKDCPDNSGATGKAGGAFDFILYSNRKASAYRHVASWRQT